MSAGRLEIQLLYSWIYSSSNWSTVLVFILSSVHPASIFSEQKSVFVSLLSMYLRVFLTGQIRVVDLDISQTVVIEHLQFILICFCNICKLFYIR